MAGNGNGLHEKPRGADLHPYNILEFYPDATLVIDNEGMVLAWNKAMEDMTGVPAKDVIGKGDYEYALAFYGCRRPILIDLLGMPREQVEALYSEVSISNGKLEAMTEKVKLKGREMVLWGVTSKLYGPGGKAVGAIESIRDVTGQVRTERELKKAREELELRVEERTFELARARGLLQATLDTIPIGVVLAGRDTGLITYATRGARDIFFSEMVGIDICGDVRPYRLLKPDGSPLAPEERPLYRSLFYGERFSVEEIQVERADGSIVTTLVSGAPVRDEDGRTAAAVVSVLDITGRKQAENALVDAKRQAELYLDLMGHDINNMNQIALGYLELAEDTGDDRTAAIISKALEMLNSSTALITNLRKIQRIKGGAVKPERTNLEKLLSEVRDEYASMPGREITIAYDPVPGCEVMADPLLKEVFSNIVGNAIKHSTGSLSIGIKVEKVGEKDGAYYEVSVEDNGPGIPDEVKEKVFDRLVRGPTGARGHGLGLYLVKTLVEGFQGNVRVEDRVKGDHSKGCRFVVGLPAAPERAIEDS
jgi:signal transduction histidine kinase